ncbi:MAG: hypothetical protein A2624_05080 [Gammaproteobacteria bacterium RIFCSPHIGHO2_01_FULL_42_8]|nr:MAG: hypothetical protein A2624_05080 [Gammaproteobacteria bacterium RIFCSPHIGHO2_01_FULL_42_8]
MAPQQDLSDQQPKVWLQVICCLVASSAAALTLQTVQHSTTPAQCVFDSILNHNSHSHFRAHSTKQAREILSYFNI